MVAEGYKYFECRRCAFKFRKFVRGFTMRCPECETGCIEYKYRHKPITDFDKFTQMKLKWYKNPKMWEDNIKHRQMTGKGGKIYVTDNSGSRIGELPTFET